MVPRSSVDREFFIYSFFVFSLRVGSSFFLLAPFVLLLPSLLLLLRCFFLFSSCFSLLASFVLLLGSDMAHLGSILAPCWTILAPSWAILASQSLPSPQSKHRLFWAPHDKSSRESFDPEQTLERILREKCVWNPQENPSIQSKQLQKTWFFLKHA